MTIQIWRLMSALKFKQAIIFLACIFPIYAEAFEKRVPGARAAALSGSAVSLTGPESLFNNQAGITASDEVAFLLFFENLYFVREFPLQAFGVILPSRLGHWGISLVQFGEGSYGERQWAVTYARQWGKIWSASLQFDAFSRNFPETRGNYAFATTELGIQCRDGRRFMAGLHLFNPVRAKADCPGGREDVPLSIRIGFSWLPGESVTLSTECATSLKDVPGISTGLEYLPHPAVTLRAGVRGNPLTFSGGAGFRMGKISVDFAFHHHGWLGIAPAAGIIFEL